MRAICVDDEALVLELTVSMCKDMAQIDDDRCSFCGIRHDTVHRHCCFSIDAGLRDTALADSAGACMVICDEDTRFGSIFTVTETKDEDYTMPVDSMTAYSALERSM